ncbi:antA/AntB antirepressor family protein [Sporomusa acidovorans]|uniref:AntA/AntB antirepressor domain-containing protein n=1 Tax=Sporomusa acidovorans (strain ATCC 49682 / DSM 3132 / Mol) TaxID=1123286 RepID=A0ABZ3J8P8_SPOA4|nr:antA/AntB antirepressor family protein [Sporomusa acidovorans]OZC16050.1 AntA/AntB antirepressor [Sporomusa acidovorans DSM 3132]SDD88286.1 Phage anti-repressor protein [Sporomusa acidovorans]
MNQLIKIDNSGKTTAKELYDFLGLNSAVYARWCKTNIVENQFAIEGTDYFPFNMNVECGGQASTNYYLTIDFAKKLCMVSKSERGEQARNYFIEVEKRYKQVAESFTTKLTPQPRYRARMISTAVKDVDATAKQLMKLFAVKDGIAYAAAVNMVEETYQIDMSPVKKLLPAAVHETGFMNPTQIGQRFGGLKAQTVNQLLMQKGLQAKIAGEWRLTDDGKQYAEEKPYERNGHSGYQIQWNESVIIVLTDQSTIPTNGISG